ncbi:hypothetical protein HAX54_033719, partial [Datura stramonium]|nr:hypothetical protein [Datura stramonium]
FGVGIRSNAVILLQNLMLKWMGHELQDVTIGAMTHRSGILHINTWDSLLLRWVSASLYGWNYEPYHHATVHTEARSPDLHCIFHQSIFVSPAH